MPTQYNVNEREEFLTRSDKMTGARDIQTVYKVVTRGYDKDSWWSCIVSRLPHLNTIYRVGKWAKAPVGGLLVFSSLDTAKDFRALTGDFLFVAQARGPVPLPIDRLAPYGRYENYQGRKKFFALFRNLWKRGVSRSQYSQKDGWPTGTVAYREVKLVRRIS